LARAGLGAPPAGDAQLYVCGPRSFIDAALAQVAKMGFAGVEFAGYHKYSGKPKELRKALEARGREDILIAVGGVIPKQDYDELYRASRRLPDGAERNALYRKMAEIVAAYNPWWIGFYTIESTLVQPWVGGYRKHAYWEHPWKYMDVDATRQKTGK